MNTAMCMQKSGACRVTFGKSKIQFEIQFVEYQHFEKYERKKYYTYRAESISLAVARNSIIISWNFYYNTVRIQFNGIIMQLKILCTTQKNLNYIMTLCRCYDLMYSD